jgi:hypothetical protein
MRHVVDLLLNLMIFCGGFAASYLAVTIAIS